MGWAQCHPEVAARHGITVAEITGSNVVSVAEHNVLQILALVDRIAEGVREILALHLDGRPVPDDFVVTAPDS